MGLVFRRLLFFLFLAALAGAGFHFTLKSLKGFFRSEQILTPDFQGRSLTWVLEHQPEGVELQIVEKKHSSEFEANHVMDQDPEAGTRMKRGRSIYVTISLGSDQEPIPSVQGLSLRDAGSRLRNQGLSVGRVSRLPASKNQIGLVLAQEPPAGSGAKPGMAVDLLMGIEMQPPARMPALQGLDLEVALKHLKDLKMKPSEIGYRYDPSLEEGVILEQVPRAGTALDFLQGVELVVNRSGRGLQASRDKMVATVQLNLPPGLENRRLRLELVDSSGGRILSEETHAPGTTFEKEILFQGQGYLNVYLDGIFFQKIPLQGEPYIEELKGEAWR